MSRLSPTLGIIFCLCIIPNASFSAPPRADSQTPPAQRFEVAPGPADTVQSSRLQRTRRVANQVLIPVQNNGASIRVFGMEARGITLDGMDTYISFTRGGDSTAFRIGEFGDYKVISASAGRLDLEVNRSVSDPDGTIVMRTRRYIVTWPSRRSSPAIPTSLSVTPAL